MFGFRRKWIFVLITALITMQWANAHIHLAEHHDHDGYHHQHNVEIHSHNVVDHHGDTIDLSHLASSVDIVALEYECSLTQSKKVEKTSLAVFNNALNVAVFPSQFFTQLPVITTAKLNYLDYSTVQLRAPPPLIP